MAIVFAKANKLTEIWSLLKEMSKQAEIETGLVTTTPMTCLMKCLGEGGLVNEAVHAFYSMK